MVESQCLTSEFLPLATTLKRSFSLEIIAIRYISLGIKNEYYQLCFSHFRFDFSVFENCVLPADLFLNQEK